MKNVGFRIYSKVQKPDPELVEAFRHIAVANIADCMNRAACIDSGIRPMNDQPLLGTAFTVKTRNTDNLLLNKAIDMAKPGDVIVVDVQGDTTHAVIGELMILWAKQRGLAGIIVDGAIRDAAAIKGMDIAVYAAGVTPNGPYKDGPGEINVPISCGNAVIKPGDILVGDADGIVVIDPQDAAEVLAKAKATADKEVNILEDIKRNAWDRTWIDKALKEKDCEFID
ncbi:MAG TPA: RraA family protein [Negativicutes bacterium]|jgi:RraA family protein